MWDWLFGKPCPLCKKRSGKLEQELPSVECPVCNRCFYAGGQSATTTKLFGVEEGSEKHVHSGGIALGGSPGTCTVKVFPPEDGSPIVFGSFNLDNLIQILVAQEGECRCCGMPTEEKPIDTEIEKIAYAKNEYLKWLTLSNVRLAIRVCVPCRSNEYFRFTNLTYTDTGYGKQFYFLRFRKLTGKGTVEHMSKSKSVLWRKFWKYGMLGFTINGF